MKLVADPNPRADNENEKIKLTWEDFSADFNSNCPPFQEIGEICKAHGEKMIDLRSYMVQKPFKCFEHDSIESVLQLFRHMDLRTLPVLGDKTQKLVGVITRQDIFQFMSL